MARVGRQMERLHFGRFWQPVKTLFSTPMCLRYNIKTRFRCSSGSKCENSFSECLRDYMFLQSVETMVVYSSLKQRSCCDMPPDTDSGRVSELHQPFTSAQNALMCFCQSHLCMQQIAMSYDHREVGPFWNQMQYSMRCLYAPRLQS